MKRKIRAMTSHSKIILLLLCIVLISGCSEKEKGDVTNKEIEMYYVKTLTQNEYFSVEEGFQMDDRIHVVLKSPEFNNTYLDSPPGSFLILDLTEEEYIKYIDHHPVITGDFVYYTIVDPKTRGVTTIFEDIDTEEALRKAASNDAYYFVIPEEDFDDYMSEWKYNYWKTS